MVAEDIEPFAYTPDRDMIGEFKIFNEKSEVSALLQLCNCVPSSALVLMSSIFRGRCYNGFLRKAGNTNQILL